MAAPRDYRGQAASPGIAVGPAFIAAERIDDFRPQVSRDVETSNLTRAIEKAIGDLRALAERSDPESASILDFQIEMLLDHEILEPALDAISEGAGAALAWCRGLDGYIAEIEQADDDQLAARAVDVIDLKNRVLAALDGRPVGDFPEGAVFVGKDLAPSLFLAHDWSQGGAIALSSGSVYSHVALLARSRSVPMVVAIGEMEVTPGRPVAVDGSAGALILDPVAVPVDAGSLASAPPVAGGVAAPVSTGRSEQTALWLNISDPAEIDLVRPEAIAGIGLVRTEFLMPLATDALNEERHLYWYRRLLGVAGGRPVTVRMLDLGGDKSMPGLDGGQTGSFLGLRGIRLLLERPEIARVQARALLRAAADGDIRVLLPMVTVPGEVRQILAVFRDEFASLQRHAIVCRMPPVGIMIEVPAAAIMIDMFDDIDFFSCGTNDLAQFLAGAARDIASVAPLNAATRPALYRLLGQTVTSANVMGKQISICGDLAGEPSEAAALLGCGFRNFSVAPSRLEAVRMAFKSAVPGRAEG